MKRQIKEKMLVKGSIMVLFGLGLTIGIAMINLFGDVYLSRAGILSEYYLSQYKYMEINHQTLFFYIMSKRMKWIVLLWVLGYTAVGIPCMLISVLWLGFSAGVLLSIAVVKLGGWGILFCLTAVLPQMIIYIPAFLWLLMSIYNIRLGRGGADQKAFTRAGYLLIGAGVCALFVVGIVAESYINPWLLKQILRFL